MYGTIATAALLGFSLVSARPASTYAGPSSSVKPTFSGSASASAPASFSASASASVSAPFPAGNSSAPMSTGAVYGGGSGGAKGGVFSFPPGGFPTVSPDQITTIEQQAHGELSNKGAPTGLQPDTVNSLAFVAFNELFEVAFFTELVQNITLNKPGFGPGDIQGDRDVILANLKVILAQEELHVLNAEGALKANGNLNLAPCTYKFPVSTFAEAIGLASTFTDVVLSTLPDIQTLAGTDGDFGLIGAVGSVIGQEGEQNGFYRSILGKVPSQLPFLTGGARNFAYNAILQNFIASCPSETIDLLEHPAAGIPLNETGILNVLTKDLGLEDVTADFSIQTVDAANTESWYNNHKSQQLYVTYLNQQNKPLSVPIHGLTFSGNAIQFKASFPGKTDFLNGLTIAAVTASGDLSAASADAVAAATLFGPGLIEVD